MNKELYKFNKAKELKDVADCLLRHMKALGDSSYLRNDKVYSAAKSLESSGNQFWSFSFDDFELPVSTTRHVKPRQKDLQRRKFTMYLSMEVIGKYPEQDWNGDPFVKMNFSIKIKGIANDGKAHWLGFHLDKHIGENDTDEPHPLYHLQFSNEPKFISEAQRTTANNGQFDYGDSMFLDTPRIVHYPVDFALGIAFALSNFYPELFNRLKRDPIFSRYCKDAQSSIINPYFAKISSYWNSTSTSEQKSYAEKLFPSLI